MCGILVHARATLDSPQACDAAWERAMARLDRRGPDGRGRWQSASGLVRLGHTRLAINDLSPTGAQPMVLERRGGDLALVANGEVYNAPALRRRLEREGCRFRGTSDCEVVLHAVDRWGFDEAIDAVRGMIALAVWDDRERTLRGAVDHAGMKPLVFAGGTEGLVIASDADAVLAMLARRPDPNPMALAHVLAHGYSPAPETVWQGVSKLGPGECLEWRPGAGVRTRRWWSPPDAVREPAPGRSTLAEQAEEFGAIWGEVVADHLLSDVPVGLFLSGGLDSSAVAVALAEQSGGGAHAGRSRAIAPSRPPVHAFTLALESSDDEAPAARQTAAHFGLGWTGVPMGAGSLDEALTACARAFDEPQGYGALLTAGAISRAARRCGKVMLAGDGGDEAFAGYTWHAEAPRLAPDSGASISRERGSSGGVGVLDAPGVAAGCVPVGSYLRRVLPRFEVWEVEALLAPLGVRYAEQEYAGWAAAHDRPDLPWPRWAQRMDLMTFCAGSILPKVDRASMDAGLEVRAPFLDRRVLEWALSLPVMPEEACGPVGGHVGGSKPILRRYLDGRVPPGVLTRPKQGFSLRIGSNAWAGFGDRLLQSRLVKDGVLGAHVRRVVDPDDPRAASRIPALCMLAAWWDARA
ncbi:MAG: asparagine synthase (glutamine-hydrolyzing) [Phycisphaeraceae bacterium]|nr:asparagine synthase (glutamine-hydrolyzing) [Phycisphaeraceae bacterium]